MLTKATKVAWTEGGVPGSGQVITDEQDGHVLVAVDAEPGYRHLVIFCAVTWLTPVES